MGMVVIRVKRMCCDREFANRLLNLLFGRGFGLVQPGRHMLCIAKHLCG